MSCIYSHIYSQVALKCSSKGLYQGTVPITGPRVHTICVRNVHIMQTLSTKTLLETLGWRVGSRLMVSSIINQWDY